MKPNNTTKRLRVDRDDATGVPIVVSDCGKVWKVPEGHSPKWYMTKVCEMLVDAGFGVIMDAKSLEGGDDP